MARSPYLLTLTRAPNAWSVLGLLTPWRVTQKPLMKFLSSLGTLRESLFETHNLTTMSKHLTPPQAGNRAGRQSKYALLVCWFVCQRLVEATKTVLVKGTPAWGFLARSVKRDLFGCTLCTKPTFRALFLQTVAMPRGHSLNPEIMATLPGSDYVSGE